MTRSRSLSWRTLPSSTVATLSRRPASRGSSLRPLSAKAEEGAATRSPGTRPSAAVSSSVMPSLKYSLALSGLALTSGRTAIELGLGSGARAAGAGSGAV